jgi:hypothetical protein
MRDSLLFRAMQLCEQNVRLRQSSSDLLRRAEDAVLAARLTTGFSRAGQQTPEQWSAHSERWATMVGDAAEQLLLTEAHAILADNDDGDTD